QRDSLAVDDPDTTGGQRPVPGYSAARLAAAPAPAGAHRLACPAPCRARHRLRARGTALARDRAEPGQGRHKEFTEPDTVLGLILACLQRNPPFVRTDSRFFRMV